MQISAEQGAQRGRVAVSLHRQRLPRLLACLSLLFRPPHPRVPGLQSGHRLRHPGGGQDQRRRCAASRVAPAVLAARDRRVGHQHRPLPARGGPLRPDAGHHRRAGGIRYAAVDPDQGHPAATGLAVDRRGRPTSAGVGGGVAGRWRPGAAPGCRVGYANTAGAAGAHYRNSRRRLGLSRDGRAGAATTHRLRRAP
ncbi:Uncharacterised protein [Mycobacterium tuberculosis]|nr:Uncharacterised protein [Mycobacterium tuberculosis]COX05344.1 Uncharacterised protein [Mycobacterium tuberculosis]